ncbi:HAD family hydrolase [Vulgatibacter incomptus]|nr:HAD family hydrolase [Vulgatibacter incomptus]
MAAFGDGASVLRAILFDLDDTLIPEAAAIRGALAAACGPLEELAGLPNGVLGEAVAAVGQASWQALDVTGIDARFGVTWEECLWGRFGPASQAQIPTLGALAVMLRRQVFTDALTACGVRSPLGGELEARFAMERRKRFVPYAEAPGLIQSLRDRALLVGCATNGASEVQREKLAASGTGGWFDAVTVSAEEGVGKPDPAMIVKLCEELGVSADQAIYVGNSRRRDVAASRAAGIPSVLIERFEPEDEIPNPGARGARKGVANPHEVPDRMVFEVHGILGFVDGWRAGRAFRVVDGGRTPWSIDLPEPVDGRFVTRVGADDDPLRPLVTGSSPLAAIEAGLRSLRARGNGRAFRHELGEPIDWDALLR